MTLANIDLSRNRIPANVHTIHLIAVCGTGMGALACILKDLGYAVSGSDAKTYPPMSDFLAQKGIPVSSGFSAQNLIPSPDLVVVGNAVTRDNPEARQMLQAGLPFCSMPQAINAFMGHDKKTLLVTGTHGKTTTSALLGWMLYEAGFDPSLFVGGILKNFESNYRLGSGPFLIVEGDEYDTAFFDKGPKFRHYDPVITLLTSIEFDHADIFKDLDAVRAAFTGLAASLRPDSHLIAYDRDPNIDQILKTVGCEAERYGRSVNSAWRLGRTQIEGEWTFFEVFKKDRLFGKLQTRLPGEHNLKNILAVLAAADRLGIGPEAMGQALQSFTGVKRRQELRGEKNGIRVIDDFAHHPTAVRETIRALKPFCTGRLWAIFEPRTNSSRRNVFQTAYAGAFAGADLVCIRQPPLLEKIPPAQRFSSQKLAADLKAKGISAFYFPDTDAIIEFVVQKAQPGDTLLIMSNGGFDDIHRRLLACL